MFNRYWKPFAPFDKHNSLFKWNVHINVYIDFLLFSKRKIESQPSSINKMVFGGLQKFSRSRLFWTKKISKLSHFGNDHERIQHRTLPCWNQLYQGCTFEFFSPIAKTHVRRGNPSFPSRIFTDERASFMARYALAEPSFFFGINVITPAFPLRETRKFMTTRSSKIEHVFARASDYFPSFFHEALGLASKSSDGVLQLPRAPNCPSCDTR